VVALIGRVFVEYGWVFYPAQELADLFAFERHYSAPHGALWVVRRDGGIGGSVAVERLDAKTAELHRLYLDADLRGRRLGRELVETVLAWCAREGITHLVLWSDTRFDRAHALYERMGFVKTGERVLPDDPNDTREYSYARPVAMTARGATMTFRDRLGFDAGGRPLEGALEWAGRHRFHHVDFNADAGPNRLDGWPADRVRTLRDTCARHDIHLGLHTSSAVNVAEFSPHVSEGVEDYLRANVDLAVRLGCEWLVVHAGFHFSSALEARKAASLERLKRLTGHAEHVGATLLLENLNFEPARAEVHYLGHTVAECRPYFAQIQSERFGWAFTVNHAHLVPEGIDGFLDAFGVTRIGEVRLADNTGEYEVHLNPGEGTIDFKTLFDRLESAGYAKHYSMAFGGDADKLAAREKLAALR